MDAVLDKAVDLARAAAVEVADDADAVGAHLSAHEDGDRLVTHLFACTLPGYRGWVWSVTIARAPRAKDATVCESHLVPADDALLAPSWIPWADRIRPGDLEPSMVLPIIEEDPRLMPGYQATGDEDQDEVAIWELGLGRERVLAPQGRDAASERWTRGTHGPSAASAIASNAPCSTCAFFIPLTGSMRTAFGACSNEWSPSDGRVVAVDHGCGAHSQTDVEKQSTRWPAVDPLVDTDASVAMDLSEADEPAEPTTGDADEAVQGADAPAADASPSPEDGAGTAAGDAAADVSTGVPTDVPAGDSPAGAAAADEAGAEGAAQEGAAQEGAAQDGAAQDASAQDGSAQDGSAQDGASAHPDAAPSEEASAPVGDDASPAEADAEPAATSDAGEPAADGPGQESTGDEAPGEGSTSDEAPADEAPAGEASAEDAPATEAPDEDRDVAPGGVESSEGDR